LKPPSASTTSSSGRASAAESPLLPGEPADAAIAVLIKLARDVAIRPMFPAHDPTKHQAGEYLERSSTSAKRTATPARLRVQQRKDDTFQTRRESAQWRPVQQDDLYRRTQKHLEALHLIQQHPACVGGRLQQVMEKHVEKHNQRQQSD